MMIFSFAMLLLAITQGSTHREQRNIQVDVLTVALGDSLTLNCTYDCSVGFVRGCWIKASDRSGCYGKVTQMDLCTISLHLPNVTAEDLENYTCYTQNTDHVELAQNIQQTVLLQLRAPTTTHYPSTVTHETKTNTASVSRKPKDISKGEIIGIKALASVTVAVATALAVLAAYLCLSRNKQRCSCKGEPLVSSTNASLSLDAASSPVKGERVTLRIPTPDNDSDTEVPYADIMITVRGVSTPELTQVGYLSTGDGKEWWRDESQGHLQASRSADRLHLPQPREISRKMSTNSEYAVITYA